MPTGSLIWRVSVEPFDEYRLRLMAFAVPCFIHRPKRHYNVRIKRPVELTRIDAPAGIILCQARER